jgi:hypothetical protein
MTVVADAAMVAADLPALLGTDRYGTGTDSTDWYTGHPRMTEA